MDTLKSGHLLYSGHLVLSQCNAIAYNYFTPEIRTTLGPKCVRIKGCLFVFRIGGDESLAEVLTVPS